MNYYFPPNDQNYTYLQTNRSDDLGSLWSTMNVDLQSNLATLRVAPRTLVATNTASLANLGLPVAFTVFEPGDIWAIAGTRVFMTTTGPNAGWVEDTSTGAATDYAINSDLAVFEGDLFATTQDELLRNDSGSSWSSVDVLASAASQHAMTVFSVYNRLYYGNNTRHILSIDDAGVVSDGSYELDFSDTSYGAISCIVSNNTSVWVGTDGVSGSTEDNGFGYILQWDGISAGLQNVFPFVAGAVRAMCVYENYVYAMDSQGILYKYSGYAFEEIGRLPFTVLNPRSNFIHRNGLIPTKNGTILAMVETRNSGNVATYQENIPSGVWEWSEDFGFTHKYSLSYTPASSLTTITDFGQNRISVPGALYDASTVNNTVSGKNGSLLIGATYFTNASSTTNGIFVDDQTNTVVKKGYIVSTWFNSSEIQDNFVRVWSTFRRLLDASDSVVSKYRVNEEEPIYATITWVNTTSFTTTTDITAYGPDASGFDGTTGGEVEVQQGTGSGSCAHITSIVNNGGTYTVTLDEEITGVTTGTAIARFQKWIKLNQAAEPGQLNSYQQAAMDASNIRIQLKNCFTFTGNGEFFKSVIVSNADIKITK